MESFGGKLVCPRHGWSSLPQWFKGKLSLFSYDLLKGLYWKEGWAPQYQWQTNDSCNLGKSIIVLLTFQMSRVRFLSRSVKWYYWVMHELYLISLSITREKFKHNSWLWTKIPASGQFSSPSTADRFFANKQWRHIGLKGSCLSFHTIY